MKSKRTVAFVVLTALICTLSIGAMVQADGKEVTVRYVDRFAGRQTEKEYRTQHETVKDFITENKIKRGLYDRQSHSDESVICDGTEITITKAIPVTIVSGDTVMTTTTTMPTVNSALLEAGMTPGEEDIVIPEANSTVTEGMQIVITSITKNEVIETEYTDFDTVYREDSSLEKGKIKIIQNGKKGEVKVTYKLTYENGELTSKEELTRLKISDPEPKIIAQGTKEVSQTTAAPKKTDTPKKNTTVSASTSAGVINGLKYTKKLQMTATAYSAFNSKGGYAKTASGMTARKGIVAVDRSVIPLGTRLYIEGYGEAIAGDVGGAIKGNKIDLCFEDTNKNLMKFGRQQVQVYILE